MANCLGRKLKRGAHNVNVKFNTCHLRIMTSYEQVTSSAHVRFKVDARERDEIVLSWRNFNAGKIKPENHI